MLAVHLLLALGLAAFVDQLSPLGVAAAFIVSYLGLRLGAIPLGIERYLRRLELGTAFAVWFAGAILRAGFDVARVALARELRPRPAVVKLTLQRRDERFATVLGCLLTLTPGTVVLDYVPATGVMYVHALDADDASSIEAEVRQIEGRLLRWLDAGVAH